jgi:hypothetical protein
MLPLSDNRYKKAHSCLTCTCSSLQLEHLDGRLSGLSFSLVSGTPIGKCPLIQTTDRSEAKAEGHVGHVFSAFPFIRSFFYIRCKYNDKFPLPDRH